MHTDNPDIPPDFPLPRNKATEPQKPKPETRVAAELPGWLKTLLVVMPLLAFGVSVFSLWISFQSMRFTTGHTRLHEDHDVVAKVLGVIPLTPRQSANGTNAELVIDIAVIHRGTQTEIIREALLYYAESTNFTASPTGAIISRGFKPENVQLGKGDRQVLHLVTPWSSANTGKRLWVGVAVRAVAPNADDIEVLWPVCEINLAEDQNGSWLSWNKDQTPQIQIISNERMPHQRLVPDGR